MSGRGRFTPASVEGVSEWPPRDSAEACSHPNTGARARRGGISVNLLRNRMPRFPRKAMLTRTPVTSLAPGCVESCPACAHRGWSKTRSEAQKLRFLADRLGRWRTNLAPVSGPEEAARWSYRDRVCLAARWEGAEWILGMIRGDAVIGIPECPVHNARIRRTGRLLQWVLPGPEVFPLRYVVQSGAQLVLVVKSREVPPVDWLTDALRDRLAAIGVGGLWLHCNPVTGKRVFAKQAWTLLWGESRTRDSEGRVHGPTGFMQVSPELHTRALDAAESFLGPTPGDALADLYCGFGAGLARWVAAGVRCMGIELSGEAVECARINAPGAEVLRGTCVQRIPQLNAWLDRPPSRRLLYINPPRTGIESAVLEWIGAEYRPRAIAYLSCSPGTLARDLEFLGESAYVVRAIKPYDFFPQTRHVEALALLDRC